MSFLANKHHIIERVLFLLTLVFTVSTVWWNDYIMSFDGPVHAYNAGIMSALSHDGYLRTFFMLQPLYIPNYLSHFILSHLIPLTNAVVAEKILVSSIVIGWSVSFRALVAVYTKGIPYLSVLIFPLLMNNLLHMGFYNFNLGFVFLNLQAIVVIKAVQTNDKKWWWLMGVISLMLFYSHLMGFVLELLVSVLIIWRNKEAKVSQPILFARWLVAVLPGILLTCMFYSQVEVYSFEYDKTITEKLLGWLQGDPMITYNGTVEGWYGTIYAGLLFILLLLSGWKYIKKPQGVSVFLIVSVLLVFCNLLMKDGALSGMFTMRTMLTGFYFIALTVAIHSQWSRILYIPVACVIFYIVFQVLTLRHNDLKPYQTLIKDVESAAPYIRDHSIVQAIRLTTDAFSANYGAYAVAGKPSILLENYEASIHWFPLNWRGYMKPILMDNDHLIDHLKLEYVLVFGFEKAMLHEHPKRLLDFMSHSMQPVYTSADGYCTLYALKSALNR